MRRPIEKTERRIARLIARGDLLEARRHLDRSLQANRGRLRRAAGDLACRLLVLVLVVVSGLLAFGCQGPGGGPANPAQQMAAAQAVIQLAAAEYSGHLERHGASPDDIGRALVAFDALGDLVAASIEEYSTTGAVTGGPGIRAAARRAHAAYLLQLGGRDLTLLEQARRQRRADALLALVMAAWPPPPPSAPAPAEGPPAVLPGP